MKCPKCKGCGMMDVDDGIFTIHGYDCDYCLGTGYIEPITNEEYIRSCSTEQLAEELLEHFEWGLSTNAEYCFTQKYLELTKNHITKWLKENRE